MIKWKKIIIIGTLFLIWLLLSCALGGEFSFVLENDVINGSDRAYTHGTRFFNLFDSAPTFVSDVWKDKDVRLGIALAQYMYTPSDISVKELIEDDRPYGGWLYLEALVMARDNTFMDIIGIDVGVTGEASLSGETQTFVHRNIDSQIPQGWDNQIKTELGINLSYQKKYRLRYDNVFDVVSQAGGALGNIYTYANIGTMIRAGWNIPDNFGALRMEPSVRNTGWSLYLSAGTEGRYVMRNIFLDGNTFQDSHSVDKREFMYDIYYGLGISWRNFEVLYSDTSRSKEFHGQDKENKFGTVVLSWKY